VGALIVWLSPLAFVPVPWPDDSAFYFVARELFRWPPRWVMLPQAPFEPSYRIFNFNTMPLYPILIGLGRWIGIDGTFLIKFWPLTAWAASGSVLVSILYRRGLPFFACLVLSLIVTFDPELQWASTLVRPESLIGLFGTCLVLGLTLGFPKRLLPSRFWDPVAALLALAAYAHFNAIHLIFPVVFALLRQPDRLLQKSWSIVWKTTLYLSPWLVAVIYHWGVFRQQMAVQWYRLSAPNPWLNSWSDAISCLFKELGNPVPWPPLLHIASVAMWILILGILGIGLKELLPTQSSKARDSRSQPELLPASGWLLGALWLWHSKPEFWFVYYIHAALWCACGLAALRAWNFWTTRRVLSHVWPGLNLFPVGCTVVGSIFAVILTTFSYAQIHHAITLDASESWHWPVYYDWIDCIDSRLSNLEKHLSLNRPFRVWDPTFPDATIELSRRHPDWELTRTNDFMDRVSLALQHGHETDAVIVNETLNWQERNLSEKLERVPQVQSMWMLWQPYFLNQLWRTPGWKPNRFLCQRGRWQSFIFMVPDPKDSPKDPPNAPNAPNAPKE
jgi:hypothetical protein